MKFACCGEPIEGATSGSLVCIKCKCYYHLQCLGSGAPNKKDITKEFKSKWLCPNCAPKVLNQDESPIRGARRVPGAENVTLQRGSRTVVNVSPPAGQELPLTLNSVKDILASELVKMRREFEATMTNIIARELKPLKDDIAEFKKSLNFLNSQHEDLKKRIDTIEDNIKPLVSQSSEIGDLKASISNIESDKNKQEQWARRSNVETFGIPEKKGDNLMKILESIGRVASFPINVDTDIDIVTRVAPKSNDNNKKPKPIVVRFLARHKKDNLLASVRRIKLKLKDIGFLGDSLVYVNEHLTSINKALLQRAKVICKEKDYMYVWVKNCSILARRSDTTPVIHITSHLDLCKIK